MLQIVVCRVIYPALYRDRVVYRVVSRLLPICSLPLTARPDRHGRKGGDRRFSSLTLMEHVAERAIVQDHDLTQVGLDSTQILDEGAVPECTVLPVVPCREEFPFRFQPVDYWVSIFLNRGREYNEVEPLADLISCVSILSCAGGGQQQTPGRHSPVAGSHRNVVACEHNTIWGAEARCWLARQPQRKSCSA